MVPPLSPDVRDRILSHLVPPSIPLPTEALASTFIARLNFLPPDDGDTDSHLSPFPAAATGIPNPLTAALEKLAGGLHIHPTEYSHDGEMTIARTVIGPEFGTDGAVETYFEHEAGKEGGSDGRGWVYRGAKLGTHGGSETYWVDQVDAVRTNAYGSGYENENPDDYWAGFTPPGQEHAELHAENDEDSYWAMYGAGAPASEHDENDEHDAATSLPELEHSPEPEPVTPPPAVAAPDPAATLSLLLSGLAPSAMTDTDNANVTSPTTTDAPALSPTTSPRAGVLEQKLRAKVRAQLMRAWTEFSAGQDAEYAGCEWLRVGREVADAPSWGASTVAHDVGDARAAVLRARVEAAREVFDVLGSGPSDGFWRLVEEAIRQHNVPVGSDEPEFEF